MGEQHQGRVDPEQRRATIARLGALRAQGALTTEHARRVADGLGVSLRTVWRWLKEPPKLQAGGSYRLSAIDREAFAHYRGNVAALHRAREAVIDGTGHTAGAPVPAFLVRGWAGAPPVGLRTLQRAFARELTRAEQAAWRTGEPGRRAAGVHLTRPPTGRNQIWELDHKQIPILVLPPRGAALCPWMTTIVDDATRALVGWAITATPHAGTVLTAIRMGLVHDPDRGPFGAVPTTGRVDRGLEFAAASVRKALAALGVEVHRLPAYTPHRKGKIERLHRTLEQTLFSSLPGYTKGPRNAAGRLHSPWDDSAAGRAAAQDAPVGPLRIEHLAERVRTWAHWYNTQRPHTALDGRTPAQSWAQDTFAVHRIDADQARHLLLADVERTIGKDGIRLNNLAYLAPELHGRRGQVVQVLLRHRAPVHRPPPHPAHPRPDRGLPRSRPRRVAPPRHGPAPRQHPHPARTRPPGRWHRARRVPCAARRTR
ncbi:integrase core domain-containing protein [Nocardiopsis kunsanensis]|uniref:integrase core domain-containing protein n=1 Tax=Nocardiopsis kunsanensis TaxID=141693 RepID=UPI0003483708|nr:integrase core domain-containing protein [Nocardiopsis kunsanensis]